MASGNRPKSQQQLACSEKSAEKYGEGCLLGQGHLLQ